MILAVIWFDWNWKMCERSEFVVFFSHFGLALKWNIQLRNVWIVGLLLAHSVSKRNQTKNNIQTITMTKQVTIFVNHNHHYMMLMASFGLSNWLFCCQWFFSLVVGDGGDFRVSITSFIHWMTMWKPAPTKHH